MEKSEQPKFMVRVSCMTFNHVNYITDTMNGFTMQQTDFPFVCCIMDDASTDGEQEVIKKYLQEHFDLENKSVVRNEETDNYRLTYARHKTNENCYFAVFYLKYNHHCKNKDKSSYIDSWNNNAKYLALCEGDDYWTNPQKLQKQYEALETYPECNICFGITEFMTADGHLQNNYIPRKKTIINNIITLEDFCREQFTVGQWTFHTSTFFYRKEVFYKFRCLKNTTFKDFPYGDICVILTGLLMGDGVFIDEKMSNYRLLSGGFNSNMKANPQLAIIVEEKLIKGFLAFDQYTNYKYHQHVNNRLLRSKCLIDYHKGGENGLVFLKPKYWKIAKMQGMNVTSKMVLQTLMPGPYYFLRKLIKGK